MPLTVDNAAGGAGAVALGLQPDQAAGIGARLKRPHIVGGFTDADRMDRDAVFLGQ